MRYQFDALKPEEVRATCTESVGAGWHTNKCGKHAVGVVLMTNFALPETQDRLPLCSFHKKMYERRNKAQEDQDARYARQRSRSERVAAMVVDLNRQVGLRGRPVGRSNQGAHLGGPGSGRAARGHGDDQGRSAPAADRGTDGS